MFGLKDKLIIIYYKFNFKILSLLMIYTMNQELTKNDTAFLKKVINELNNPLREKIDDDPYEEFNQHIKREKDYEQITSFYNMLFPTIDERTDLISEDIISEDIISDASMNNNTSHINSIDKNFSKQTISMVKTIF